MWAKNVEDVKLNVENIQKINEIKQFSKDQNKFELINLPSANLTAANLPRINLKGANLTGATLIKANLTGANLINANLSNANLTGANLTGANLTGANLSNANLTHEGATIAKSINRRESADLTRANLTRADLTRADLTRANLTGANLTRADLERANLTWADLTCANLDYADLERANLTHAYLERAYLGSAKCMDANFTNADLVGAILMSADCRRANLSNAGCIRADLSDANFTGANFTGADLERATLCESNFMDANLTDANFTYADLLDSDCRRANLTGTNLTGANIEGVIFSTDVTAERLVGTFGTPIFRDADAVVLEDVKGVAHEIHNASNKYIDKCIHIISPLVNIKSFYLGFPDIVDNFVKHKFTGFIISDKFTGNKEIILPKLEQILTKLKLSEISNEKKLVIGKSIDFVLQQSPEFINFYIDSFIQDCYHAYSGPNGMSCTKGIYERFPMLIGPAALAMCPELSSCSNITYKQLIEAFELGNQIDFNSLLQEWSEIVNNEPIVLSEDLTSPQKKELIKSNLIKFIKDKYAVISIPITEEEINKKILGFEYIYDGYIQTNTISFGGSKPSNKTKRGYKNKTKCGYKNKTKRGYMKVI